MTSEPPDAELGPHQAEVAEIADAARLLIAFNDEYDDPAPAAGWFAGHLRTLIDAGDTEVWLARGNAGVAVLRYRRQLWEDTPECYLAEMYIQPQHRGQGLGGELLDACIDAARSRGATYMDVATTEDDVEARKLYESRGFGRTEGRDDGPLAFYYERDL